MRFITACLIQFNCLFFFLACGFIFAKLAGHTGQTLRVSDCWPLTTMRSPKAFDTKYQYLTVRFCPYKCWRHLWSHITLQQSAIKSSPPGKEIWHYYLFCTNYPVCRADTFSRLRYFHSLKEFWIWMIKKGKICSNFVIWKS